MSCCSNYKLKSFSRKYPIGDINTNNEDSGNLARVLSWYDVIANGVAATVGAGIFVTSGVAVRQAGPAMVFSFLASAFAALLSALCYAEMGARIPLAGSAYTFTYVTLGEFLGWIVGWNITLEYAISASAVAVGWAGYLVSLLNLFMDVPDWLFDYHLYGMFSFSPIALIIIVLVVIILLFGVKESTTFNLVITIMNVSAIAFIIVLGFAHLDVNNWDDFFPVIAPYDSSLQGIFAAAGTLFFSYIGFDAVTTLAGEVKNPKKDLPIGIIGSLLITTLLYVGVSLSLTGMISWHNISTTAPLSDAFSSIGINWAGILVGIISITTLTATVLTTILGQPRIYFQMATDGLLFSWFGTLNKNQVPVFGTIITGVISGLLALFFNLDDLTHMISAGTLISYAIVCSCVIILRYKRKAGDGYGYSPIGQKNCRIDIPVLHKFCGFVLEHQIFVIIWYYIFSSAFAIAIKLNFSIYSQIGYAGAQVLIILIFVICEPRDIPEGFSAPLVPLVPFAGTTVNLLLIFQLPWEALLRLLVWTGIGTAIYLFYGIHFSKLGQWAKKELN